jgi:DNA-binding PadR family transcriptional regulator
MSPLDLTVLALLQYKPLHPYGLQRLIRQWGKDQVVNVTQRASLYRSIERLSAAGFVAVRETERNQDYPERTVYEITETGSIAARVALADMLSTPRQEYPRFPAALSHLVMLDKSAVIGALKERIAVLNAAQAVLKAQLKAQSERLLPRIALVEEEYLAAMRAAEIRWLRSIVGELESGKLAWSTEALLAFGEGPDVDSST